MPYLSKDEFKALTVMPKRDVDAIETATPGWLGNQLLYVSREIDARLRKRYDVPFDAPYPHVVQSWLTRIVTQRAYLRRGVDPNDRQAESVFQDAADAKAEIKEAADSEVGLFDLPEPSGASGISRGAPRVYSEASPYVHTDVQRTTGRADDSRRRGNG
jgi:hypothetical protein